MTTLLIWLLIILAGLTVLARLGGSLVGWTAGIAVALIALGFTPWLTFWPGLVLWALFLAVAVPLNVPDLRQRFISEPLRRHMRDALPEMSETEREAIEAGTIWWEADLFRGDPDWDRLLAFTAPKLSERERAFLEGPVEELCRMLNTWQITHELHDLPPEAWQYLREHRFFGMIIPEEYGGLGFSAHAHSAVVMKISSRSPTAGVSVMVPNSLGPAELLLEYGTPEQKDHYLPRLADGREIPCFGLTGPEAGSDATAIPDYGVVCEGEYQGRRVLGLRTNWEKRYITLGPVATVLGLAFRAYDPDGLLGDEVDLGITCALVPTDTKGVEIGNRHDPLGTGFQNGPNRGRDVFIPLEWVIGEREGVGQGWRMLMDCLSVGRGISLPALGAGGGKCFSRVTGAYARVRRQFRLPIGRFEGVQEPLARMAGGAYMMDSARLLTLSALDAGERPSVVTAMLKHFNSEMHRQAINDAMDIHGGRGICDGPNNYLAIAYRATPVAITVEGANILTRSMIVFGQGALRCHPHLLAEIAAAREDDTDTAREQFDQALLAHLGYTARNVGRALAYGLTRSAVAPAPQAPATARFYRRLARMSAAFSVVADVALLLLGGDLKRREMLSGRFADAMIHMFVCSAALKHFEDGGRREEELPLVEWSVKHCLYRVQGALDEILRNFPLKWAGIALRWLVVFPLGRRFRYPNDRLSRTVADCLLEPSAARDRLTAGIYIDRRADDVTGCLEHALELALAAEPIEARLRERRIVQPPMTDRAEWVDELVRDGVLDEDEAKTLTDWWSAQRRAIDVDDFPPPRPPIARVAGGDGAPGRSAGVGRIVRKKTARKKAASKKTSSKKTSSKKTARKKAASKKVSGGRGTSPKTDSSSGEESTS